MQVLMLKQLLLVGEIMKSFREYLEESQNALGNIIIK